LGAHHCHVVAVGRKSPVNRVYTIPVASSKATFASFGTRSANCANAWSSRRMVKLLSVTSPYGESTVVTLLPRVAQVKSCNHRRVHAACFLLSFSYPFFTHSLVMMMMMMATPPPDVESPRGKSQPQGRVTILSKSKNN
jgi:hypothetical protein